MATSRVESAEELPGEQDSAPTTIGLWPLTGYFAKLGTIGFGGPVALVGFMHRDLVEKRRWVTEDTYKLSLALAQIMPGPLAAQTAIAIGYFEGGILGATLVGLAFVLPSFLMVVAISMLYVAYGGLWWMQALFYGIGATVIAIIAIAAYKLSRSTNQADPLLWAIFAVLAAVTVWAQAELAEFFIMAGLVALCQHALFAKRVLDIDGLPRAGHCQIVRYFEVTGGVSDAYVLCPAREDAPSATEPRTVLFAIVEFDPERIDLGFGNIHRHAIN